MRIVIETDDFSGDQESRLRYLSNMNAEGAEYADSPDDGPVEVSTRHYGFGAFIVGILEDNGNITLAIGD